MSGSEDKKELRALYARAREALSPADRAEFSRRAMARLAALPEFREADTVLVYRSLPGELDPSSLLLLPAAAGKCFAFPVVLGPAEMTAWIPGGWRRGAYGIQEPDPAVSAAVSPEEIDLVVCPGLAFDASMTRLGMGGGYYDRFLPRCGKAAFIMAAFEAQRAPLLPRDPQDVPMHRVVTEASVCSGPFPFRRD